MTNLPDYLRVYTSGGKLFVVAKRSGTTTTLWSGVQTQTAARAFELRLRSGTASLSEGPVGAGLVTRTTGLVTGVDPATGQHVYLQASTNAAATYTGLFDEVRVSKVE